MWFWVLGGALLVVFFGLRYVMQERKRREMEAEAAFQRERLQQATERQRRLQQAQKEKGAASASGPRLLILWGSQMGTAQEFAESLAEEAKDLGFSSECVDLEMFDTDTLAEEKTVVFVVATYGDGDPTDNAKQFAEWLHDEQRGEDELANVSFGVFGLGSRSYDHFCAMGHKTDERMAQLGAKRFVAMGEGDDDSSLEEDFDKWKKKLWSSLCQRFGMGNTKAAQGKSRRRTQLVRHDLKANPRLRITEHWEPRRDASTTATTTSSSSSSSTSSSTPTYLTIGTPDARKPFAAPIRVNRELHTSQSDRSCRHVEIALQGVLRYEAGDHLGVYAENDAQVVDHLLSRLNINAEQAEEIISLINTSNQKIHTPPATIRRILTSFVDITTPPRRSVLAGLAEHASDEAEKQQLQKMGDPSDDEGAQEYNQRIKQELRTIGEVLELFPSVRVPVDLLVELLPRLAPRYYSISSSSKAHPDSVHITAVVTTFTTPTGRLHNGVCTTWLRRLGAGDKIPCFVRTSEFRLPANPATDIIMIGPGTGLAPFRGFIQERRAIHAPGKNVLFFGCRSPDIDHIYKEEMEAYVNDGTLILHLAYSRVSDKKVYVQHRLQEQGRQMWDLIEGGAYIYVCGDGQSMAHDVRSAILSLASTYGSHSAESAEQYLATLQQRKRYQTDVW